MIDDLLLFVGDQQCTVCLGRTIISNQHGVKIPVGRCIHRSKRAFYAQPIFFLVSPFAKRAIDVKQLLEEVDARVKDLGIDLKRKDREDDSDSDDDDFVEVEEKNGDYEEDVVEPPTETELMTFYPLPKARTSANKSESKLKRSSSEALKSEELDPTTFAATVKKVKSDLGAENEPIPG